MYDLNLELKDQTWTNKTVFNLDKYNTILTLEISTLEIQMYHFVHHFVYRFSRRPI